MKLKGPHIPLIITIAFMLFSCAPVLDRRYMDEGSRAVSFASLREHPDEYRGKLFILGGVVVRTRVAEAGSEIEALHVPVDRTGAFEDSGRSEGRFLAVLQKEAGLLDPVVYRKGRRITLAGEFVGVREGKIDEMVYVYPLFRIRQVYLWPRDRRYSMPLYYYDPWFYPYPYYFSHPWWYYPQRYAPVPVYYRPVQRRSLPPAPKSEREHERERK